SCADRAPRSTLFPYTTLFRSSSRLKQAGGNLVLPKDEAPGLAMGLGGVGISLQDLAQLYAGLARLGAARPLREIMLANDDREPRSEEHTSELQSHLNLVCRLL